MAAFAQASRPQTPTAAGQSLIARSLSSSNKLLPDGACNFRNFAFGPNTPTCGCKRFWCYQDGATASATNGNADNPWCICGHHACFHDSAEPVAASATAQVLENSGNLVEIQPGIYVDVTRAKIDGRSGVLAGSQSTPRRRSELETRAGVESVPTPSKRSWLGLGQVEETTAGNEKQSVRDFATKFGEQNTPTGVQRRDTADAFNSGFPSVPSMCLLNSDDLRPLPTGGCNDGTDAGPEHRSKDQSAALPQNPPGLGLSMHSMSDRLNRACLTSFYPEGQHSSFEQRDESLAPTVQYSTDGEEWRPQNSPSRAFIDQVRARNLQPHLDVPLTTSENAIAQEELLQSATELATPSTANTPDLREFDHAMQEAKHLVDVLVGGLAATEKGDVSGEQANGTTNTSPHTAPHPTEKRLLTGAADSHSDEINSALTTQLFLRKLALHFNTLNKHLTSYPNVTTVLQNIQDRLTAMENASFSTVPADEIHDKFELFDARILDLEHRMNDYDKLQDAIDEDQSSRTTALIRRRAPDSSFSGWSNSGNSTSPSALIAAAVDREELNNRLDTVEQRLEDLESIAAPSVISPWEIEVVMLPWGRELKGIWFAPDEMSRGSRACSQISDDWTQVLSARSSAANSLSAMNDEGPGWSSEAIHDWADMGHASLAPKACGRNGLVYKRLESRGLIRKVSFKEGGARHILTTIAQAFGGVLNMINQRSTEHPAIRLSEDAPSPATSYLGLAAPVIPLRKVHKDTQLMFLGPSELITPSIWNAEFLKSSVLMRAPGGLRRLYVTQTDSYLQKIDTADAGWTWQRIRELPRVSLQKDGQPEGESTAVGEADAKEPCWEFYPQLDTPLSEASSFTSQRSLQSRRSEGGSASFGSAGQLSLRLASQQSSSSEPTSANEQKPPITPQSELPAQRPRPFNRTISLPIMQEDFSAAPTHPPKRRMASFDDGSVAQSSNSAPTSSSSNPKRRRLTRSTDAESGAQPGVYGFTPRRSKEPPSPPFFNEAPNSSDVRSQATAVPACAAKAGTPGAYATPHSGPVTVEEFWPGDGGDTEADSPGDDGTGAVDEVEAESWEGVATDADVDVGAEKNSDLCEYPYEEDEDSTMSESDSESDMEPVA